MKPTLIVEGIRKSVVNVNLYQGEPTQVMVKGDGEKFEHHDINESNIGNLVWEGRYKPAIETLNTHLEESEQHLQELKNKIAQEVIASDIGKLTHTDLLSLLKTLKDLTEEHQDHKEYIDGLFASIELVKGLEKNE